MISGFRREIDENCAFLGYNATSSGNFLLTFRDNVPVPHSGVKNPKERGFIWDSWPLKMVPMIFLFLTPEVGNNRFYFGFLTSEDGTDRFYFRPLTPEKGDREVFILDSWPLKLGPIGFVLDSWPLKLGTIGFILDSWPLKLGPIGFIFDS